MGEGDEPHVAARELASSCCSESSPSLVDLQIAQLGPVRGVASCQGTMLAWCSICVISTASPGPRFARPHE